MRNEMNEGEKKMIAKGTIKLKRQVADLQDQIVELNRKVNRKEEGREEEMDERGRCHEGMERRGKEGGERGDEERRETHFCQSPDWLFFEAWRRRRRKRVG